MNKTNDHTPEEKPATPMQKFFVPGYGEVEAADIAEVEKKVKSKVEAGDGNK